MKNNRLGVGFIGSGFNAKFHMLGWKGVRDADVLGVWSPNAKNATAAARYANELDVGGGILRIRAPHTEYVGVAHALPAEHVELRVEPTADEADAKAIVFHWQCR